MSTVTASGELAFALGAIHSGIRLAASYPGSPSRIAMVHIIERARERGIHVEWSASEKVAFEVAFGASVRGARALFLTKGVGLNIALDPILTTNLAGCGAGFVILLGDDPGAWGSQNEQDSRPIARLAELPLIEPADPQGCYDAIRWAFELAERIHLPIIVRETRGLSTMTAEVTVADPVRADGFDLEPFEREGYRWIPAPWTAVDMHAALHEKAVHVRDAFERHPLNRRRGDGALGLVAVGYTAIKLRDVLGWGEGRSEAPFSILELATTYPLPPEFCAAFLRSVERCVVVEENEPHTADALAVLASQRGLTTPIVGMGSDPLPGVGEISRAQLGRALEALECGFRVREAYRHELRDKPPPSPIELCGDCPYIPAYVALQEAGRELGLRPIVAADPGCAVRGSLPPFEALDIKISLGSAISIASGVERVQRGVADEAARQPVIAVVGDSSFFHSGVVGLINAAHTGADIFVLILDNDVTALTGYQPHPGTPRDAFDEPSPAPTIESLAEAAGAGSVEVTDPLDQAHTTQVFKRALTARGLRVIIARSPCTQIPRHGQAE